MKQNKTEHRVLSLAATALLMTAAPGGATAGMDPFVGEISYVAFNYAPDGWLQCDGQVLPVNQYNALFSLIGNAYGGNGSTTFALPDMRGRVPVHRGQHPGGSMFTLGQTGGAENTALTVNNLPAHSHTATATSASTSAVAPGASATSTLKAVNSDADQKNAGGNSLANAKGLNSAYSAAAPSISMNAASIETTLSGLNIATTTSTNVSIGSTGNSQPFAIMQPYTVVNCIIAWQGIYPPRP